MLHPGTELKIVNAQVGYGVFAKDAIPMGTITWALDPLDQVLDPHRVREIEVQLGASLEHYTWTNGNGKRILCWDFGRYMNHSCSPNSIGPGGTEFELAVRDIAKGEELTCDYRMLNLERPMQCLCGSDACKGVIGDSDLEEIAETCDQQVAAAVQQLQQVEQPLRKWISGNPAVELMLRTASNVPSVMNHRWPRAISNEITLKWQRSK